MGENNAELNGLIERCNRGERQAWEQFYARYVGIISAALRRHCAANQAEIDDLVQEVFVALFNALKTYDPGRPLEVYILEVVRRVRISRYRKDSARKRGGGNPEPLRIRTVDEENERGYVTLASSGESQEASLIKAQEGRLLRKALDSLSESCRKLLGLRYDEGLSFREISALLGVKEVTLRSQVQRCLSLLGQHYSRLVPAGEGVR